MDKNLELINRLKIVECRDSSYVPKLSPLVMSRAKGSLIWDVNGNEYIDLCAGFGALPLGHASDALLRVTRRFDHERPMIEHAMGDVYPSEEKILFLEQLKKMIPQKYELGAVALSGGQSVEIALKTAMLATKNSGFIVFDDAYHGLDLGVLPLTSRDDFRAPFKNWISEDRVARIPYGANLEQLENGFKKISQFGLAAIVVEPIQGRAGVRLPPNHWLSELAHFAHNHSGLLILDEIFTGMGRIGTISSGETIDADISCFGKAIGGGFPISACFAKRSVMDAWPESRGEALHTGTFFGHPFSAAVGRQTLLEIERLKLAERSALLGAKLRERLEHSFRNNRLVKSVRGQGLFVGVEFSASGYAASLMDIVRTERVLVLPSGNDGSVLSLTPSLNIPEDLLWRAVDVIVNAVS